MPFIACLNNVTTTHATHTHAAITPPTQPKNTRPTPTIKGMSRQTLPTTTHQEKRATIVRTLHTHHTPQPGQTGRTQPKPGPMRRAVKMLASTMQISNNNPTNPHHPHKESTRRREEPEGPRPHTPTTTPSSRLGGRACRLILQDPTVCPTIPPPT